MAIHGRRRTSADRRAQEIGCAFLARSARPRECSESASARRSESQRWCARPQPEARYIAYRCTNARPSFSNTSTIPCFSGLSLAAVNEVGRMRAPLANSMIPSGRSASRGAQARVAVQRCPQSHPERFAQRQRHLARCTRKLLQVERVPEVTTRCVASSPLRSRPVDDVLHFIDDLLMRNAFAALELRIAFCDGCPTAPCRCPDRARTTRCRPTRRAARAWTRAQCW
ncbi:MAG: hypothetical protein RL701_4517 [Pseudomonadota bacterium]